MYQRFAYRIVLQGYWLEGGSIVFYFQPFYRWIVGVPARCVRRFERGRMYWDGACLLAGALLSFPHHQTIRRLPVGNSSPRP